MSVLGAQKGLRLLSLGAVIVMSNGCAKDFEESSSSTPTVSFVEVERGLYRGGCPTVRGLARLKALGVRTIVDLENDPSAIAREKQEAERLGLTFVSIPLSGLWKPTNERIDEVLTAVKDGGLRPTYVHCLRGEDRTGLVIALYRVLNQGWTAWDADAEMHAVGFKDILVGLHHYFEHRTGFHRVNGRCGP